MRLPVPPPRHYYWSGRRDSNPRPPPWQGDVLPLNHFRIYKINGAGEGSRTPTPWALDPKSSASANSATPANGELCRIRTRDPLIKSHMLYQLS